MLERTENDPNIATEKRAFYERLLDESDEELEAGELPRDKIEHQLQQMN